MEPGVHYTADVRRWISLHGFYDSIVLSERLAQSLIVIILGKDGTGMKPRDWLVVDKYFWGSLIIINFMLTIELY
jgi:hypothetical protein